MTDTYVLLDSTRSAPQHLQHKVIKSYADVTGLNITFYGAEFMALEHLHLQFISYIDNPDYSSFLLYSVYQLYDPVSGFDLPILKALLQNGNTVHFALQAFSILSLADLQSKSSELLIAHVTLLNRHALAGLKLMAKDQEFADKGFFF